VVINDEDTIEAYLNVPERDVVVSFEFGPGDDTMVERYAELF
jgi:hypothetical protein